MGARLLVHPTSITSTIDRLERDGLVRRVPHPDDRRTVLAEITDDGRRVVDEATEALTAAEFGVRALPPDVVAWLRRAVERLPAEAPAAS
jgi:DNA-binding MarR family transcriptional regulator